MTQLSKLKIGIVVSLFNNDITERLYQGAHQRLLQLGILQDNLTVVSVPGAVEIPITAQLMAKSKVFSAIICLGAVIRGDTGHYDLVCQQVSMGCQRVALDHDIPVVFGVLTTDNEAQALARAGGSEGNKGAEAADVALTMIEVLRPFQS